MSHPLLTTSHFSRRSFLASAGATAATLTLASPAFALFKGSDQSSTAMVDHSAYDALLQRYVQPYSDGINRVRYAALKANDAQTLNDHLARMSTVPVESLNRNEQFAYWANLYNAVTLKVIIDAYPVRSIRSIGGGLLPTGPWKDKRFNLNGQPLSLDDIEHGIMRQNWNEPRVHYAVNCASFGCPNLATRAFTAANLNGMLEQGAADFVNHPRGVSFRGNRLYVSSIYSWFKEDFGGNDAGVIAHLRRYARGELATKLAGVTRIAGDDYDWSLNDAV